MKFHSQSPIYRQIFQYFVRQIESGGLAAGDRLPATRELAGLYGVNRTTVSAAYELLEAEGFITGQVGRGSFVATRETSHAIDWNAAMKVTSIGVRRPVAGARINFAGCRPPSEHFPLEDFQQTAQEVLADPKLAAILQLGSPAGFEPLRQHLLSKASAERLLGPNDDLLITNGCQQAFDLLCRVLVRPGTPVAIEDPVYSGVKSLFAAAQADIAAIPVEDDGVDGRAVADSGAGIVVVTPNFQNPTGITMSLEARQSLLRAARQRSLIIIENDIYGALRYEGAPLPTLKQMSPNMGTVLLRSFSKIAFPGLRLGWVIAPKPLIAAMREAKQLSDLHSDQFSQAVMLRFAESGRLDRHLRNTIEAGRRRLQAAVESCARHLPDAAEFTRPQGGMSLWVTLPSSLHAADLLERAQRDGVSYVPGSYFEVSRHFASSLRLSFAGLTPNLIREGITILGRVFERELNTAQWVDQEAATVFV